MGCFFRFEDCFGSEAESFCRLKGTFIGNAGCCWPESDCSGRFPVGYLGKDGGCRPVSGQMGRGLSCFQTVRRDRVREKGWHEPCDTPFHDACIIPEPEAECIRSLSFAPGGHSVRHRTLNI